MRKLSRVGRNFTKEYRRPISRILCPDVLARSVSGFYHLSSPGLTAQGLSAYPLQLALCKTGEQLVFPTRRPENWSVHSISTRKVCPRAHCCSTAWSLTPRFHPYLKAGASRRFVFCGTGCHGRVASGHAHPLDGAALCVVRTFLIFCSMRGHTAKPR